jgi:hypothetical protein
MRESDNQKPLPQFSVEDKYLSTSYYVLSYYVLSYYVVVVDKALHNNHHHSTCSAAQRPFSP